MRLVDALRNSQDIVTAFVGAGGKTTAIFETARELIQGNFTKTVLITTTTHFGSWQVSSADHYIQISNEMNFSDFINNIPNGIVLLAGGESDQRLSALADGLLEKLRIIAEMNQIPLLVEADGSRNRPLKAPAEHEPNLPSFSQNVVVVAGLRGIGKPLIGEWVHRPDVFARLSRQEIGDVISADGLVNVLLSPEGGLKNIPHSTRRIVLLNQADTIEMQSLGKSIAGEIANIYHSVIIAALQKDNMLEEDNLNANHIAPQIFAVFEQIAGIILAAGGSSRFGTPKQLLPWRGEPFVRHIVKAALNAGIKTLEVVVGAYGDEVERVISDLPLRIVNNQNWMDGISTSIQAGITGLPSGIGGAIFFQADQPQVSPVLVKKLMESHHEKLGSIIAPQIDGQRGNPVLFDQRTFPDLLSIRGDVGGRSLFSKYPIHWVEWHDAKQTLDIDTAEDYQKFLETYGDSDK